MVTTNGSPAIFKKIWKSLQINQMVSTNVSAAIFKNILKEFAN